MVSGTVGGTTLTVSTLPAHQHAYGINSKTYGHVREAGHIALEGNDMNTTLTGESMSHNHSILITSNDASTIPMYYSMSFIMRLL